MYDFWYDQTLDRSVGSNLVAVLLFTTTTITEDSKELKTKKSYSYSNLSLRSGLRGTGSASKTRNVYDTCLVTRPLSFSVCAVINSQIDLSDVTEYRVSHLGDVMKTSRTQAPKQQTAGN